MKKKAYLGILLSLVLFILLGSLSNAYCKTLTKEDIANCINNFSIYKGLGNLTKEQVNISYCETVANTLNNYQNKYVIVADQYNNLVFLYGSGKKYIYQNRIFDQNSTQVINSYSVNNKQWTGTTGNSYNNNFNYCYTDAPIYQTNLSTIQYQSGYMNPSYFFDDSLYKMDYFTYIYDVNLQDIIVDEDFETMKQVNSTNTNESVAEFGLYTNLDTENYKPTYSIYKYMKPQNYFEPIATYDYNNYSYVNDELGRIYLTSKMLIPNTIIEINLFPTNLEDFSPLSILFYVTDSNTIITTDSTTGKPKLDEDNTFDDNYYTRYTNIINNILNENKGNITGPSGDITGSIDFTPIVDNQTSLFDRAFNISGEKIDEIFEEAKSKINIESGEIAEYEIIKNYLEGQPGDFIISWQRKPTHLSIGGTPIAKQLYFDSNSTELGNNQINFSQLERDNQDLHEALTWSRRIIAFALYSLIIHEGYILLLSTLGVGVGIYGSKQEEKAILRRQQEEKEERQRSQEQRWRDQLERQKYNEWLYKNRKR